MNFSQKRLALRAGYYVSCVVMLYGAIRVVLCFSDACAPFTWWELPLFYASTAGTYFFPRWTANLSKALSDDKEKTEDPSATIGLAGFAGFALVVGIISWFSTHLWLQTREMAVADLEQKADYADCMYEQSESMFEQRRPAFAAIAAVAHMRCEEKFNAMRNAKIADARRDPADVNTELEAFQRHMRELVINHLLEKEKLRRGIGPSNRAAG